MKLLGLIDRVTCLNVTNLMSYNMKVGRFYTFSMKIGFVVSK